MSFVKFYQSALLVTLMLLAACSSSSTSEETDSTTSTPPPQQSIPIDENPPQPVIDLLPPAEPDPQPVENPLPPAGSELTISISDITVPDEAAQPLFTVSLSSSSNEIVRVRYETRDGSATAGVDYVAESGLLEFNPGDTAKHVDIELLKTEFVSTVSFELVLSAVENAVLDDAVGTATLLATDSIAPIPDGPMLQESVFDPDWGDLGVFSNAGQCASCHEGSSPDVMIYAGKDISPPTQWQHGMMAHSVNDPYYQAVVADEVENFPELAGLIEDTCLKCHAPMAHTQAHETQTALDTDGFYRLDTAVKEMHAREGISCTACHQIEDDGKLGTMESFSGNYSISPDRREIFGPFANPIPQPMLMNTQYRPVQAPHMSSSEHCATCHTLFTPTINVNDGQLTGTKFAEQTPYLEWLNSVYADGQPEARTCQQCHMPEPDDNYQTPIATRPNGSANANWPERSPFSVHEFVGGNTHTLTLLRDYRDVMGIASSTSVDGFNEKIVQTRNMLAGAARVSVETPSITTDALSVPVTITNLTGHKLPSSYPSRRMWLHLTVRNNNGEIVFESGQADADGHLSVDARHLQNACLAVEKDSTVFDYNQCYEPHRDVITAPEQIAIYESVLGDVNGEISYVLLYANEYLKDNRIPPKGFSRNNVPANGASSIFGAAATDSDFNAESASLGTGQDTVHYRIDISNSSGPYEIKAELLYQSVRPGFVHGLLANENPRVARYKQMYSAVPPLVETIAEGQRTF